MNCPFCGAEELPFFDSIWFKCSTRSRFSVKPKGLFTKEEIRGVLIKQGFTRSHTCYQYREAQLLALIGKAKEFVSFCQSMEGYAIADKADRFLPQIDKVMEVNRGH